MRVLAIQVGYLTPPQIPSCSHKLGPGSIQKFADKWRDKPVILAQEVAILESIEIFIQDCFYWKLWCDWLEMPEESNVSWLWGKILTL